MKLIIASNNQNKVNEIKDICRDLNYEIVSLKDEGIFIDIIEDGSTIEENSFKKANEIYKYISKRGDKNFLVLSDDSGLMVDYLNGEPGVLSARFSGENSSDEKNSEKVLKLLDGVNYSKRGAKFLTVLTLIDDNGKKNQFHGGIYGKILEEKRGENGFGYDSIFYIEEIQKTFAELSKDEKNLISHRYKALMKLREYFKTNM
ncbi:MAG TPA: RdgB/HAM1 family non-canonical purine NTP pyrophosphatase [Candidatus Dwaynia gallinarum]|nr:RdgB/HAM1 family non-canonical purine NTP pyrophosphatase [Candidatus Dwaynia gallinarum]